MRIAVVTDFHLGFDYGGKRERDSFINAESAFDSALAENPDLVLVLGDVFHDKVPRPEIMAQAIDLFSKVALKVGNIKIVRKKDLKEKEEFLNQNVPAILGIYGTHETRNKGNINPIHLLEKAGLFMHLHTDSLIVESDNGKVGLHGLSGVPDIYVKNILEKWNVSPFPGMVNIFMAHQSFKELLPMKDPRIASLSDLPKGFSLYLLGHIHWRIEDKHPLTNAPIIIPGSTMLTQMRKIEAERKKGIYILEIKEGKINAKFKEIRQERDFHLIENDVSGKDPSAVSEELKEKITKIIKTTAKQSSPLIRVKLKGDVEKGILPTDFDFSSLIKLFSGKAILYFDKSGIYSSKLSEKTKMILDLKSKKVSVEEIGTEILLNKLKADSMEKSEKIKNLFLSLSEGNLEKAEEMMLND